MAPSMTTTPVAPDTQGERPPGTPALDQQNLFPDEGPDRDKLYPVDRRPTIEEEAAQDNAILVALVLRVLPDSNAE